MHGTVRRGAVLPGRPWANLARAGVALVCICTVALVLVMRPQAPGSLELAARLDQLYLWHSLLPRLVVAIVAGASLGLSGVLLQRILRNPIADASTLGIASGSELALTVALGFAPAVLDVSREWVAFSGGIAAVAIVVGLNWRRALDPVAVALSGMMVGLMASALAVAIILARGEYAMSIFIWGAGSLAQQDWSTVLSLAPRFVVGLAIASVLLRPLTLLGLDDAGASSLGLSVNFARLGVLALAVWLSASVTAEVGVIGFLGLAAPAIARMLGARTMKQMILAAPLSGAALLLVTDCAMQLLSPGFSDLAPAGATVALLGGPVLLFLLSRIRGPLGGPGRVAAAPARELRRPYLALALLAVGVLLLVLGAVVIGRDADGWMVATGRLFEDLLVFRGPRTVAAGAAGAMLAAAGFLMQKMTGNPVASPEVLGVSAGTGAGLTIALLFAPFAAPPIMLTGMALGGLAAFLVMLVISAQSRFSPERLLLAGVAIGAFSMTLVTVVLSSGGMRGFVLLTWLSGSTNRVGAFEAWIAVVSAIALIAPLPFFARWLAILPLGDDAGRALGLALGRSRLLIALFAALLTAVSCFIVGPLSLIGLVAPHVARLLGFQRVLQHLIASILLGAGLLAGADWLSRLIIYPYQLPVGLFASLVGGPYLIWLLNRTEKPA